jgi:hypothetical protein
MTAAGWGYALWGVGLTTQSAYTMIPNLVLFYNFFSIAVVQIFIYCKNHVFNCVILLLLLLLLVVVVVVLVSHLSTVQERVALSKTLLLLLLLLFVIALLNVLDLLVNIGQ